MKKIEYFQQLKKKLGPKKYACYVNRQYSVDFMGYGEMYSAAFIREAALAFSIVAERTINSFESSDFEGDGITPYNQVKRCKRAIDQWKSFYEQNGDDYFIRIHSTTKEA